MKISAFVPLKLNSKRLPNKNFLFLDNKPLACHIFETLSKISLINDVFCYTSQPHVMTLFSSSIKLLTRPQSLDRDTVKANELFQYAVERIDADIIVLCHATGPFIKIDSIVKGINAVKSSQYDSAFSVHDYMNYAWYNSKPFNYDPNNIIQTQLLSPIQIETSGFYIFRKDDYLKRGTRIGKTPFLIPVDFKESVDIDTLEDFKLASTLSTNSQSNLQGLSDSFVSNHLSKLEMYKNTKHFIFDFDGVLIDSLPVMETSWKSVSEFFKLDVSFIDYKKFLGIPFSDILTNLKIPKNLHDDIAEHYNAKSMNLSDKINVFPDIIKSLDRLSSHGFVLSIATSKERSRTIPLLKKLNLLKYFKSVVTPDDIALNRGKPCPDSLLLCCINTGTDPSSTVFIGDMRVDLEASQRANIDFIFAAWGFSTLPSNDTFWFNSLSDITDYFIV